MVTSRLKRNSIPATLYGQTLDKVSCYMLVIWVSRWTPWTNCIDEISSKARKIVGLYRPFSMHSASTPSFVCVTGETTSWVCLTNLKSHLIKHINQLQVIQICTQNVLQNLEQLLSYSDLVQYSNLPSLADCRKFLCYFSKLANRAVDFPNLPLIPRTLNYPDREDHPYLCNHLLLQICEQLVRLSVLYNLFWCYFVITDLYCTLVLSCCVWIGYVTFSFVFIKGGLLVICVYWFGFMVVSFEMVNSLVSIGLSCVRSICLLYCFIHYTPLVRNQMSIALW